MRQTADVFFHTSKHSHQVHEGFFIMHASNQMMPVCQFSPLAGYLHHCPVMQGTLEPEELKYILWQMAPSCQVIYSCCKNCPSVYLTNQTLPE